MNHVSIINWVEQATNLKEKSFRQAVHIIIHSIAGCDNLRSMMIMKGGILLAIEYSSSRYTTDIDFSTEEKYDAFELDNFLADLERALIVSTETLNYDVACKVQSKELKPKNIQNPTTPSLCIKIGYASKSNNREHQRLLKGNAIAIIKLDYSFNEFNFDTSIMKINDESSIRVYSLVDLVAEKFRAILQQVPRNRTRRQDIYDLNYLITNYIKVAEHELKKEILSSLKTKSESRKIQANKFSLRNHELIERSKKEYFTLGNEIEGELPKFEDAYSTLRKFYESLPWDSTIEASNHM